MAEVERTLGGIDILINNAGIVALTGGVLNETADIWDKTIETHLNASFPTFAGCRQINGQA